MAVLASLATPLTGRAIAQLVEGASDSGVRRTLDRLASQGLVTVSPAGRAYLYELNRDHLAAAAVEVLAGMRAELLHRLRETISRWAIQPAHASLFGSMARRDGDADSDIDLFLSHPHLDTDEQRDQWDGQVDELRSDMERWTGNQVQILEVAEDAIPELVASSAALTQAISTESIQLAGPPASRFLGQEATGRA